MGETLCTAAGFAGQAGVPRHPAEPDVVFCGALRFNLDPLHPLRAMMPEVMLAGDLAATPPCPCCWTPWSARWQAAWALAPSRRAWPVRTAASIIVRGWSAAATTHGLDCRRARACASQSGHCHPRRPERDWNVPLLADLMRRLAFTLCRIVHAHHGREPGALCGQGEDVAGPQLDCRCAAQ